jgi:hypothetical protein
MAQVGFSAGACNAPAFDWVRNLGKKMDATERDDLNANVSAAFALFWNLRCFWLPPVVICNIDDFMEETNMCSMSPDICPGKIEGKYMVTVDDIEFEFADARLAPPGGIVSKNYARWVCICLLYPAAKIWTTVRYTMNTSHTIGLFLLESPSLARASTQ